MHRTKESSSPTFTPAVLIFPFSYPLCPFAKPADIEQSKEEKEL